MKTAMLTPQQVIIPQQWSVENYRDDRSNSYSYLVSTDNIVIDGVRYQATSGDVSNHFEDAQDFISTHKGMAFNIHDVQMDHLSQVLQWASETFNAQSVGVTF